MISVGVHISIHVVYPPKKFEWHFSSRLTFSNTRVGLLAEFIAGADPAILKRGGGPH